MACFTSYLQLTSWIVHEAKIHYVVFDDIRSEIVRESHKCLSKSPN